MLFFKLDHLGLRELNNHKFFNGFNQLLIIKIIKKLIIRKCLLKIIFI